MNPPTHDAGTGPVTHRSVLAIALPIMLSNVSTPLLGVVDTAVVGRLPDPAYIGAVALGALVFSFVFWAFGFLRMGTTGLTAQALGAGRPDEIAACLGRALLIALIAGLGLVALQWPIRATAFALIDGSPGVEALAAAYVDIRIWAAPATLANYAFLGWFIGLGRTDIALVLQLVLNLVNMALDVLFVIGLGWEVRGVALGPVLAECTAAAVGAVMAWRHLRTLGARRLGPDLLRGSELRRTLRVNRDILVRSLALTAAFGWFVAQGARQGDVALAANAVLMQFISMSAYVLDGLAFAAEALVGRAIGAGRRAWFAAAVRLSTLWALALAALMSGLVAALGGLGIDLLTTDPQVRAAARVFLPWAAGAPLLGVLAFQLDGIFIGATRTGAMRQAMLLSLLIFLLAWWLLQPWGNHGLWAALYVHYLARTATLGTRYPALLRSVPA